MKIKTILSTLFVVLVSVGLYGCGGDDDDSRMTINSNDFDFSAVNTVGDKELSATAGGPVITVNWTVNVTVNGETTTVSGTCHSNELPVHPGDEVVVTFKPSCPEETEAYFVLPDNSSKKATVANPSFAWTVPSNFKAGMEIKGATHYETDQFIYNRTGSIKLVALE